MRKIEEFFAVGKNLPKIDAREKITGAAKYTADIKLQGMLYGKILTSPYAHACILYIDTSKARRLFGVKAILTMKDVPRIPYNARYSGEMAGKLCIEDQYILDEKVRFVGDSVAAVAATDNDTAEEALDLIEVEYEVLPALMNPEEALKPEAPKIHPFAKGNLVGEPIKIEMGDIEKGFKEAEHIFEDRYRTQRMKHCSMETHVTVANSDQDEKLTVWTSTQIPFRVRSILSKCLNIPIGKIRVILLHCGGGFGGKEDVDYEPICALLAEKAGRPVKIELTRTEEFYSTSTRHPTIIELKTGLKKDGTFTARRCKAIVDTGAYATHGLAVTGVLGGSFVSFYRCPNVKFEGYCVYTNTPYSGALRGFGMAQINFAIQSQMDAIAEKLRIDMTELVLKNHFQAGDIDAGTGFVIGSCGLNECIKKGSETIGWKEKSKMQKGGDNTKKRGMGMATLIDVCGVKPYLPEQSSAFVKFNEDGSVVLLCGATDIGQGIKTTLTQIAAEELGVKPEDICIIAGDTDITPYDAGSFASRSIYIAGGAVKAAATEAKAQLLKHAAEILEVATEELESKNGKIYVKGTPEKGLLISGVAKKYTIMGNASYEPPTNAPIFGAQFAEVEVNTKTGQIKVLRIVAVHDVGKAINPSICEGQIEGGILMGMGFALSEELALDEMGKAVNPTFIDYLILTADLMPDIKVILVESNEPTGPFGAKGIGDSTPVAIASAIANAIHDAIGVRIKELPITPEKILKALREKERTN